LINLIRFFEIILLTNKISLLEISEVLFFNLSSFQKTNKSKSIQAFFNNSIDTIESFQPHTGINALFHTLKSFLIYLISDLLMKLNNQSGDILLVYKNSPNQFI